MIEYLIAAIVGVALAAITVLLLTGRGANLIAGFNTLPEKDKEKFDRQALCKFVGKILIPIEAAVFICVIGGIAGASWTTGAAVIVSIVSLPYLIGVTIYANTGNRFRK